MHKAQETKAATEAALSPSAQELERYIIQTGLARTQCGCLNSVAVHEPAFNFQTYPDNQP